MKDKDWENGLYGACQGGYLNIIELMIEKGANDWNKGLIGACYGGHMDMVKLMIQKGVTECYCEKSIDQHKLIK